MGGGEKEIADTRTRIAIGHPGKFGRQGRQMSVLFYQCTQLLDCDVNTCHATYTAHPVRVGCTDTNSSKSSALGARA